MYDQSVITEFLLWQTRENQNGKKSVNQVYRWKLM